MLEKIIITALVVLAIWSTMWEGAIFEKIRKFFEELLDGTDWEYWQKPIYSCPICMAPWYGSIFYWIIWPKSTIIDWLVTIVGAMGFNAIMVKLFPDEE